MKIRSQAIASVLALGGAIVAPSLASAQQVIEHTNGFVCPVFNDDSQAGAKNPNAVSIGGGDASIIGPDVRVPTHATNGDGTGTPGGDHSSPGDSDYSAIWSG